MPDFSVAYTVNGSSAITTVTADTFHIDDNGFLVFCMDQDHVGGNIERRHDDGAVAAFRDWDTVRPLLTPTIASADAAQTVTITPMPTTQPIVSVHIDGKPLRDVAREVVNEQLSKVSKSISQQRG